MTEIILPLLESQGQTVQNPGMVITCEESRWARLVNSDKFLSLVQWSISIMING
jgi:hypothetical protein